MATPRKLSPPSGLLLLIDRNRGQRCVGGEGHREGEEEGHRGNEHNTSVGSVRLRKGIQCTI